MQHKHSPKEHINKALGETYKMMQNIRMSLNFMDKDIMKIIMTLIRPKLEYTAVVWLPHQKDLRKFERI